MPLEIRQDILAFAIEGATTGDEFKAKANLTEEMRTLQAAFTSEELRDPVFRLLQDCGRCLVALETAMNMIRDARRTQEEGNRWIMGRAESVVFQKLLCGQQQWITALTMIISDITTVLLPLVRNPTDCKGID